MADLGIIFLRRKHHPLIPVIIYSYYRKYAVPLFLGHPVYPLEIKLSLVMSAFAEDLEMPKWGLLTILAEIFLNLAGVLSNIPIISHENEC